MGLTTTGMHPSPKLYLSGALVILILTTSYELINASSSAASTSFDNLSEASKAAVISLLNEASDKTQTDPLNLIRLGLEKANENNERLARQDSPNIADFLPREKDQELTQSEPPPQPMPQRLSFDEFMNDDREQQPFEQMPTDFGHGEPQDGREYQSRTGFALPMGRKEPQVNSDSRGLDEDQDGHLDDHNPQDLAHEQAAAPLEPMSHSNLISSSASASASGGGAASSSAASGGGAAAASASSGSGAASAAASSSLSDPVGDVDGDGDIDRDDAAAADASNTDATRIPKEPEHVEHQPEQEPEPYHNPYAKMTQHNFAAMPEPHVPSPSTKKKKKKKKKRRHNFDVYKDSYVDHTYPNNPQLVRIKSKKRIGPDGVTEEHVETRTSVSGDPNSYNHSSTSYSSSSSSSSSSSPYKRTHHHHHGDWNGGARAFTSSMPPMPAMLPIPPMPAMPQMLPMPQMPQMPAMPQIQPMSPMAPFGFNMNPMGNYWMQQPGTTTAFASSMGGVPTTYTSGDGYASSFASAGDNLSYDMGWSDGEGYGHSRGRKRSRSRY